MPTYYFEHWYFQAANLALLLGAERIVLLGFDNQVSANGALHFFGAHQDGSGAGNFSIYAQAWSSVSPLHYDREIWNATPGSALPGVPRRSLEDLL